MSDTSDFQRAFMSRGVGNKLFTQEEFDSALAVAQAQLIDEAVTATKTAIVLERRACAAIAEEMQRKIFDSVNHDKDVEFKSDIAEAILNRIPSQMQ